VIIVKVNERLGYVERVPAMTSDDVTMDVSLQFTYRVSKPERFALEVDDPERIIFEFVQGKLRDVVNTKDMTEVMHSRAEMNAEVMASLREKEEQYGVRFITVQIQSASPPEEVVTAIKDRMVAVQRQEQAQAEAAQRRTLADAEYYAAQKKADGDAYEITTLAEADAQRIALTSAAKQEATQAILAALQGQGDLGAQYIQLLIAQELKNNSKWIISGATGESTPVVELRTTP
jgi:regulator of protease activity HflC (stomatin/prohibitin superfamily)